MDDMVKFGPKVMKGSIWDEGGKTKILQIFISYGKENINSIQFVYAVDGKVVRSEIHGEPNGLKSDIVTLDHPGEYLVSVTGQYHDIGELSSIAFRTNKRKFGPFGMVDNDEYDPYSPFAYNFGPNNSFGGFHGSVHNSIVFAIGVYVKPIGSLAEIKKESGK